MKDEISLSWLEEQNACQEGIGWFLAQEERDSRKLLDALVADNHWNWANWLLPRLMTYQQYVSYAVYAAELVIDLYEKEYPDDDRPARAIEAARVCIENPTAGNKAGASEAALWANAEQAAYVAGAAAAEWASEAAARAAGAAAWAATWASSAAVAAEAAAEAASRAARAAAAGATTRGAAEATAGAAWAASGAGMRKKILAYGLALLWPEDAAKEGGNS